MPTHSRTDASTASGRFGRSATPPRRRPSASSRPTIPGRKRTPQRSPMNKAVQSVKSALPTGGKAKTKSRGRSSSSGMPKGKGLAGLAALAGAAGVALSQRDKISSLVNRGNQDDEGRATPQAGTVPPSATPPVDQPFGAPAPERGTGI